MLNPALCPGPGRVQPLEAREARGLGGTEVLLLLVMEWCDLGSLAAAIRARKFQPHGKWGFTTTYVRRLNPSPEPFCSP